MPTQKEACFDRDVLHRFLDERLEAGEESQVLSHIGSCESCREALGELAGNESVWSDIQDHLAESSVEDAAEQDAMKDQQRALRAVKGMLAPTDNPEMMGRIGPYEVCGVIGRGSSGIVVKALDPRLNRNVAIKLLAPVYSNIGSSRRRFEREGRAVASLNNPHVIPIHAVLDFQGTPYIVMQYLPDGSLQQRIDKMGPLSTREVACVGMQIAKGLAAAHEAGIVHRDVKPANVLLESGVDSAMVTDFGLARVVDEATMTRSGSISGTPQYMSPEQARGESVDPRSDLFSLGSVMYTASTGHSPFRAETVFGVIKRVCDNDPRPLRESNPDVAEWMAAFIDKLHAKKCDDRFESAQQVAELLHQELGHLQNPTLIQKPSRSWWEKPVAVPALSSEAKPKMNVSKPRGGSRPSAWKFLTIGASLLIVAGATALTMSGFLGGEGDSSNGVFSMVTASNTPGEGGNMSLLELTQLENDRLPRFDNTIETTIDVQAGGQLFLRTNLGTVNVSTHDKPTVEMKLKHTVAAQDKETAAKIFKALKMNYAIDADEVEGELGKGKDAVIIATFPTKKLTQEEIAAATNLEELKDELQIRNNSHYRNAEFELFVPETFSLDLVTSAGPVTASDIDGTVKILTHGGHVETGNVGSDTRIETHGGHIVVLDVDGEFFAMTHGGQVSVGHVSGSVEVMSHGGKIEIAEADGTVKAESRGGRISVVKAHGAVEAEAHAGRVAVNFVEQPQGKSNLLSYSGSVQVGYVEGIGFNIDASSSNGKISGPFLEKSVTQLKQYQLNGGTAKLAIKSDNGSIKFKDVDADELDRQIEDLQESREVETAQRVFQKGYDLHMSGKIDEAIEAHQEAAQYESTRILATYNLGCAWSLKGKKDKAFKALNQAIDFGMDDLDQFEGDSDLDSLRDDERYQELISRIKALSEENELSAESGEKLTRLISRGRSMFYEEKFDNAEKLFESVLALDPENVEAVYMMGSAIHAMGRVDEALVLHKLAAESKSSVYSSKAKYNIACVHALKNETEAAIKNLKIAIKAGYVDVQHMQHDKDLKSIRDDERFEELIGLAKEIIEESADETCDDGGECDDCDDCDEKDSAF